MKYHSDRCSLSVCAKLHADAIFINFGMSMNQRFADDIHFKR